MNPEDPKKSPGPFKISFTKKEQLIKPVAPANTAVPTPGTGVAASNPVATPGPGERPAIRINATTLPKAGTGSPLPPGVKPAMPPIVTSPSALAMPRPATLPPASVKAPAAKLPLAGGGAAKPTAKNMDFDSFRENKMQSKQLDQRLSQSEGHKPTRERAKHIEGMQGGGEKYQDHKLGDVLHTKVEVDDQLAHQFQDQKLADTLRAGVAHPTDGQGAKYQDHRLSTGTQVDMLDMSAGQGAKYHDHKLGHGLPKRE